MLVKQNLSFGSNKKQPTFYLAMRPKIKLNNYN